MFFVPLAPLSGPELVRPAVERTVGVRELEELGGREALFLLDNLEHVLDAAADVAALLAGDPPSRCSQLAARRCASRVSASTQSIHFPRTTRSSYLFSGPSVRRDFVPDDCAAEICRRLDGLPLALELAAARLRSLDASTLLQRLDYRLPLLTGGARDAPTRQKTLRATIEWSYDLLPDELQRIFTRLAVFAGTFSLDAAEAVVDADVETLAAIAEASLIKPLVGSRFLMLETIREFASGHFAETHEADELRTRHAEYYRDLALSASLDTDVPGEQEPAIVILDVANLRAALGWALERDEIVFGLELLVALEQLWTLGYTAEGMRWYAAFLERGDEAAPLLRARALRSFGSSAHFAGEFDLSSQLWEESLAEYKRLEDDHGIAVLLHRLSIRALECGDAERARDLSERSLELHRRGSNDKGACQPLALLGALALQTGDPAAGVALLQESADLAARVPWRWWRAGTLSALAGVAIADGRDADAQILLRESVELALSLGDRVGLSWYLGQTALALARQGRGEESGRVWGAVEASAVFIPGFPWPGTSRGFKRSCSS